MIRRSRLALAVVPLLAAGIAFSSTAKASDQLLEDGVDAVGSYLDELQRLGDLAALASQLPLSTLDPRGDSGLDLQSVFDGLAATLPSSITDVADLETQLEAYTQSIGATAVDFGDVVAARTGNTLDLTLPLSLSREVSAPLSFGAGPVTVTEGTVQARLAFTATLRFTIDLATAATSPATAVSVQSPVVATLSADLDGSTVSVDTSFGFTTLDVDGTVTDGGLTLPITIADPDGIGGLTFDELVSTDIADLATGSPVLALNASLAFNTPITAGPDATATFGITAGAVTAAFTPGAFDILGRFDNLGPDTILSGIGQLGASVQSLSSAGDAPLPFLKEGLASLAKLAQPITDFVSSQSVICGSDSGTNPPTGPVTPVGALVFWCQATAAGAVKPGSVVWQAQGAVLAPLGEQPQPGFDGTVSAPGSSPDQRKLAKFIADGTEPIRVSATYDLDTVNDSGGQVFLPKTVSQPPTTAQDLVARLTDIAGFEPGSAIAYDDATRALTFHLVREVDLGAPATSNASFDFADKLKAATGLFGIAPTGTATVKVGLSKVKLDLIFGVLLVDEPADVDPAGTEYAATYANAPRGLQDQFFIQSTAGVPVISIDNATVDATVTLGARLGFLDIGIGGAVSDTDDTAFSITKATPGQPSLAISFNPGTSLPVRAGPSTVQIPGATTLRALGTLDLRPTAGKLVPTINAKLVAALKGTAAIKQLGGTVQELGSGTFTITADSAQDLLTDPTAFTTEAADFTTALGKFDDFDAANPQAMLALILDGLSAVLASVEGAGGIYESALPVVGKSPKELFAQLESVKRSLAELNGAPGPSITCGRQYSDDTPDDLIANPHINGNPDGVADAEPVVCRAETLKPPMPNSAATPFVWTIDNGAVVGGANDAATANTASPAAVATFDPSGGGFLVSPDHQADGYRVHLRYSDADGEHVLDYPALSVPASLQGFVDSITAKLGLKPGTITVAKQTVDVGGGTMKESLVLRLAAGLCTMDRLSESTYPDVLDRCTPGDATLATDATKVPVNLSLGDVGGLSPSLDTEGNIDLSLLARATLGVVIPLEVGATPLVQGDSGLLLRAGADSSSLGFSAKVGPLAVHAGTAVVDRDDAIDAAQPGLGVLKIGTGLAVGTGGTAATASTPGDFVSALTVTPGTGAEQDCGQATDGLALVDIKGFACAVLSLSVDDTSVTDGETALGEIGLAAAAINGPYTVAIPDSLLEGLADAIFSLEFVLDTLRQLAEQLSVTLDGAGADVKLPIIGDALDAGADVAAQVSAFVESISAIAQKIEEAQEPTAFATEIHDVIAAAVPPTLLRKLGGGGDPIAGDGGSGGGAADIKVVAYCGGDTPCVDLLHGAGDLTDLRVTMRLGQGTLGASDCTTGCDIDGVIPFDVGLDGLPVRATGAIAPKAGWTVLLDFGVNRTMGPYLAVDHASPEAEVAAKVELADSPCDDIIDDMVVRPGAGNDPFEDYETERCLTGTLGFLGVNLRDASGPTERSSVGLGATLRLDKDGGTNDGDSAAPDKIGFEDLVGGRAKAVFDGDASVNLNLRLRTGIKLDEGISLPSILGILQLSGSVGFNSDTGVDVAALTVEFNELTVDLGKTLSSFLGGILGDVKRVTSPFKPVVDTLQAPLPVLTQLAALVGLPPPTLIDALEVASGADLSLVKSFLSVIQFINSLPEDSNTLLIGLGAGAGATRAGGSLSIPAANALKATTPDKASDALVGSDPLAGGTSLLKALTAAGSPFQPTGAPRVGPAAGSNEDNTTFGVKGLTFPLFQKPGNLVKVLLGQDQTIVRYDLGEMKATASFGVTFGPILIGPIPVSATIGGSATVKGRLAFGYDTSGLRRVLDGASGEHLLDGLFLDDFDANGVDVPEVSFIGTVFASAQVDIVVIKAGIRGSLVFTLDLNLHDDNNDGKLRIDEIFAKLSNPICLFDIRGLLEFVLVFFLEFDFFFFEESFEFEIVRIQLLDFSASCSSTKPPELATKTGSTLRLNMGSQALRDVRALAVEAEDEKFVVRPIKDTNGNYSVTAFGLTQEFGPGIATIVGDGGTGKDQIALLQGATPEENPVTLEPTAKAKFTGGADNDVLVGGDADDTLFGGTNLATNALEDAEVNGNDTLTGGKGADKLIGGGGNDSLNGDLGTDTLRGGDANDSAKGGAGGDFVYGGSGNDNLDGGPGVQPKPGDSAAVIAAYDEGDTLVGGSGNDVLVGARGIDTVYGDDEVATCANAGTGTDNKDTVDAGTEGDFVYGGPDDDQLTGGPGNDKICGEQGRDILEGDTPATASGGGDDDLFGGPGNDAIFGRSGNDRLEGDGGRDNLTGETGDDKLIGGSGRDLIDGSSGLDIVIGDDGTIDDGDHVAALAGRLALTHPTDDSNGGVGTCAQLRNGLDLGRITTGAGSGNADCISGGSEADVLYGTGGGDVITGDGGDDYISGGYGADEIRGNQENDTIFGNQGTDTIFGDSGLDVIQGNDGADAIRGGIDADEIQGNAGIDEIYGDAGDDNIAGGSAGAGQPDDRDTIFGGADEDVIAGDNATITRVIGLFDVDDPDSDRRTVVLHDISSIDADLSGGDDLQGGDQNDKVYGQGADDTVSGGLGKDRLFGNEASDAMRGDAGHDLMIGGSEATGASDGDDVMSGNTGEDVMVGDNGVLAWSGSLTPDQTLTVGAFGDDTMDGNDDNDIMYGELGADLMHGNDGRDRMLGDLGTVEPAGVTPANDPDGVPISTVTLVLPQSGGVDRMFGDGSSDRMWGGFEADRVEGGPGDDYLEGNDGADTLRGFNATVDDGNVDASDADDVLVMALGDSDDIIGGSSAVNPDADKRDVGELLIQGNGGFDVILGDNGELTRTASPDNLFWIQDPIQDGPARTIVLDDTDRPAVELPLVSGGEVLIQGNGGNDKVFGEAGNDTIEGNDGHDVLVGNQDTDTVNGNTGQDDLVGGSLGSDVGPGLVAKGQLDDRDFLYGDAGADVLAGDNAQVLRPLAEGSSTEWADDPISQGKLRLVTLWDVERGSSPDVAGGDLALGGGERDRIFGQAENDTLKGNGDDDRVQGNQDDDLIEGNRGEDDLIGGSEFAGRDDGNDVIHGGGEADVAIGDNGLVDRVAKQGVSYYYTTYQLGASQRFVQLHDIDVEDQGFSGSDTYSGGQGVDVGFGQAKRDYLMGGTEDDYLEGNGGSDFVWGDVVRSDIETTPPQQLLGGLPGLPSGLPQGESDNVALEYALVGPPGTDGQDDEIGGSSQAGRADDGDFLYGNGAADFQLGDNGKLQRTFNADLTAYTTYLAYNPTTVQRRADRWDVNGATSLNGPDYVEGNDGDDYQWGQEDGDELYGNPGNDDMYGELGKDTMFGGAGEDAMLGDRGGIVDTKLTAAGAAAKKTTQGPTFFDYQGLWKDQLDRRVDLFRDHTTAGNAVMPFNGHDKGDTDYMRGGSGHDSMHGGFGDDLMNGDSGGDYLFGADGRDVMWGGAGKSGEAYSSTAPSRHITDSAHPDFAQGIGKDNLVDILFGGLSGTTEAVADVLDYRPRPESGTNGCTTAGTAFSDPCSWFDLTGLRSMTSTAAGTPLLGTEVQQPNQHHQGIDWQYGGQGRDVLQGDVGKNGPDVGDRLMDWVGAWNLYTRCNASYGDDGDVRQHSPDTQSFMQTLAWGSGVGTGVSQVNQSGTSAFRELAFVFNGDKGNSGKAFATTPGHYDQPSCAP